MPKFVRAILKPLLAVILITGLFAWGFAVERYKIFPMGLIHKARIRLRIPGWPVELVSRSPAVGGLVSIPYVNGQFDPQVETERRARQ